MSGGRTRPVRSLDARIGRGEQRRRLAGREGPGAGTEVTGDHDRPAADDQPAGASSQSVATRSSRGSVSAGSCRRSAISRRYQASRPACGSLPGSSQSSLERSKVAGSCGIGHLVGSQPKAANSRRRPSLTARPSSGSSWSVKYWNGVVAPHSSPWNSIGTNGEVSSRAAATRSRPSLISAPLRSPAARLPTWSWFWVQTTNWLPASPAGGRPCTRRRCGE